MKFYVNKIENKSDLVLPEYIPTTADVIGLFRQCDIHQSGYNCGWYGGEDYIDTKLYAYYVAKGGVDNTKRLSDVVICRPPVKYKKISITTHYFTRVIEAKTIDEAIGLFGNSLWRSWDWSQDKLNPFRFIKAQFVKLYLLIFQKL